VDIIDTGAGLPSGDTDRIFERFYRGRDSGQHGGRPARAGRGLGLTIARSLARAHAGDVVASSAGEGRGATFRLSIPAAD
jgi:signal transduction histidine kinase